jgi:hypothetical protein
MYRAILVLWINSLSRMDTDFNGQGLGNLLNGANALMASQPEGMLDQFEPNLVPIDQAVREDPRVIASIWQRNGTPVLTLLDGSGSVVRLDKPLGILEYGIKMVDEADSSRIGDGIQRKLMDLLERWKGVHCANATI